MSIGRVLSRLAMTESTKLCKVKAFGKLWSSNLKISCEGHSGFHLFERIVVAAASLVGRKERI